MSSGKECVVIDYDIGNVFSVCQAVKRCGFFPVLTRDKQRILEADKVILPGVGAFSAAMDKLTSFDLVGTIQQYSIEGGHLLGICLGMQLFFEESLENGTHKGLGLIDGKVERINFEKSNHKVPVIGWYPLELTTPDVLFEAGETTDYYFVHSYVCMPESKKLQLAINMVDNLSLCAAVRSKNTVGVQFHPEKSGHHGSEFLKKFLFQ